MRVTKKVSVLVRAEFVVYDTNNDPVVGLGNGDFTKLLSKDGVDDATAITIAEVANGRYTYTFTPGSVAYWSVVIRNATYNKRGWQDEYDVTTDGNPSVADIANGLLDLANAVDTKTLRQIFRLMGAFGAGKSSGTALTDVVRAIDDSKDRITATIDANGHRTAVTTDLT